MGRTYRWAVGVVVASGLALGGAACGSEAGHPNTDKDAKSGICDADSECSDGSFCNGPEVCSPDSEEADEVGCISGKAPCGSNSCDDARSSCGCEEADRDGDGDPAVGCGGDDCDDDDAERSSKNSEVCDDNNVDEDCDGTTFGFRDQDKDGDPDAACCNHEAGQLECGTDCDDESAIKHSSNTEACDDIDNDCDGLIDETPDGSTSHGLKTRYTIDGDGDNFGSKTTGAETALACTQPSGYALLATDCNDAVATINPAAYDACEVEMIDDDCSGTPNDPAGGCFCTGNETRSCGLPEAQNGAGLLGKCATFEQQCNGGTWDTCPLQRNAEPEVCDAVGVDENCDGVVNGASLANDLLETFYRDRDGDGYPDLSTAGQFCPALVPGGWTTDENPNDCVDVALASDPLSDDIHPGASEVCDGRDNDCDTQTDAADLDGTFPDRPAIVGTTFACQTASWAITGCPFQTLHCDLNVLNGCETSATTMSNCGSCGNQCSFACGTSDCEEVEALGLGLAHSCAVTSAGRLACWGAGGSGRLGNNGTATQVSPVIIGLANVTLISAGAAHTCAVAGASHTAYCWGSNGSRRSGHSLATTQVIVPTAVPNIAGGGGGNLTQVVSIAAGVTHSCAVLSSGQVGCWGSRLDYRLGNGLNTTESGATAVFRTPASPMTIDNAEQVVVGNAHSCIVNATGTVECWGDNTFGQIGNNGTGVDAIAAAPVAGVTAVHQLCAGYDHTCALSGSNLYCWGANSSGQLGLPLTTTSAPSAQSIRSNVAEVACSAYTTCVRTTSGIVSCWGGNSYGQRGDANPTASPTPQAVASLTGVTHLAAGGEHVCAVESALSETSCWGANTSGQLGIGSSDGAMHATPSSLNPL